MQRMPNREVDRQSKASVNWRAAGPVSLIGFGAIVVGLAIGGFDRSAFSSVLINGGTAIGLLAVIVVLESRVVGRATVAARKTATETVDQATSGLKARIVRLENLDEVQAQQRADRREAAQSAANRLSDTEVSLATVGDLLVSAKENSLFSDHFRVRTSDSPDCHLLFFLALRDPGAVVFIWLDFLPFEWGNTVEADPGNFVSMPLRRDTTVMWSGNQDAGEVAGELEAGLERINKPAEGFSLKYALGQLISSFQITTASRAAEAEGPLRLRGKLQLVINDDWVITDFGLESTAMRIAYEASWAAFLSGRTWHPTTLKNVKAPPEQAVAGWSDAVKWVTEQEGWKIERRPHEMS